MPHFRIYAVQGGYELVAELEAERPREVMARVRAQRPGATITCEGGAIGYDYLCVPSDADRVARQLAIIEHNRSRRPQLYRVYSLRPTGQHFTYELEDELLAENASLVEGRVRSRLRREEGIRVRFGNAYRRRDARDSDVLYCSVQHAGIDLVTRGFPQLAESERLRARRANNPQLAAQHAAWEAELRASETAAARRAADERAVREHGECLVCLQHGRRGVRHDDPFFHLPPYVGALHQVIVPEAASVSGACA